MSVRRLKPPIVVLTGVENSGKSTLVEPLAHALGWGRIEEAARTDAAVVEGRVQAHDIARLFQQFRHRLAAAQNAALPGILCDTGPLVLDLWSQSVFETPLDGLQSAMEDVDFFILCRTLPDWEPDPLRTLPEWEDRLRLEDRYVACLNAAGRPWFDLPVQPHDARLQAAKAAILSHWS